MERVLRKAIPNARTLSLRQRLQRLGALLSGWQRNARVRRQLAALDDHQLADIGISRSERQEELNKPFWR
jgi:uncharacterized protein YjiS (DUF1127 family)